MARFAWTAAALAFVVVKLPVAAATVDCGGHFAKTCALCPAGNGATWCNGDCAWTQPFLGSGPGQCEHKTRFSWIRSWPVFAWDRYQCLEYFGCVWIYAMLVLLYACVYYTSVVKQLPYIPQYFNVASRERGLFACFGSRDTCLYTTFCTAVVAGKNYHAAEVMGFWAGCIFTFFSMYTPFYPLVTCIRAILSMKVQQRLGHPTGFCQACCMNFWCYPCEVGRESLEVDDEVGATITCCCKVYVKPRPVTEISNLGTRLCGS